MQTLHDKVIRWMVGIAVMMATTTVVFAEEAISEGRRMLEARSVELRRDIVRVTQDVYTAVGYSPANVSMIVGSDGLIIIDTGMSVQHSEKILAAFREISDKPVAAIIYTHGHGDHTGGASVFVEGGEPQIWARANLNIEGRTLEQAGLKIQAARGARQGGFKLPADKRINNGIALAMKPRGRGNAFASGDAGYVKPNRTFTEPRREITVAGVSLELVSAPGETDDELYVWMPSRKVLFAGDNFYSSWPNLYAIRGTPYRDVRAWARSIDAMVRQGPDFLVPGHTRPFIGREAATEALSDYRDAIQFVFDKTIEGMNKGLTPDELVSYVALPPKLAEKDHLKPYYGHIAWGVRSIFNGYLGWFDGNATNLFPLSPRDHALRVAELAGGLDALTERARQALEKKDYQWAAQLADHLLALDSRSAIAMELKAAALEALAEEQANALARNYYLTFAKELREMAAAPSE